MHTAILQHPQADDRLDNANKLLARIEEVIHIVPFIGFWVSLLILIAVIAAVFAMGILKSQHNEAIQIPPAEIAKHFGWHRLGILGCDDALRPRSPGDNPHDFPLRLAQISSVMTGLMRFNPQTFPCEQVEHRGGNVKDADPVNSRRVAFGFARRDHPARSLAPPSDRRALLWIWEILGISLNPLLNWHARIAL